MGYASNQLDDDYGAAYLTPQFVGVTDASGLTLNSIKPVTTTEGYVVGGGDVEIQFLDNGGYTIEDESFMWDGAKWIYNGGALAGQDASDYKINAGLGVLVGSGFDPDEATVFLQSAGQVGTNDALTTLDDDYGTVIAGNPFPVDRTLGQFSLEAEGGDVSGGDVELQFLDNAGYTIEEKSFVWDGAKWVYNGGALAGQDASAFVIPAGQGVLVGSGFDPDDITVTLRVPAPTL